ncbi:hypothetical protein T10_6757 [Trichinella papuae]|uniref:Uncharacterized protein n=1 Tax=Trichinella papuae TaxID=268474 RepID=A0A0V1MEC0_9BILA|nr:hypothetical protein T10_6757 [Trichinella papuae]
MLNNVEACAIKVTTNKGIQNWEDKMMILILLDYYGKAAAAAPVKESSWQGFVDAGQLLVETTITNAYSFRVSQRRKWKRVACATTAENFPTTTTMMPSTDE